MSDPYVPDDELTPENLAQLDRNWITANAKLDRLLALVEQHYDEHCDRWYCGSEELSDLLNSYGLADTAKLLRAALERVILAEKSGEPSTK